jgi:hypothetical protein
MKKYEVLGFFFISLISGLLAVLFWLLPSSLILDGLGPTTDSLWQVGKLMFMSILVYTIIEYFIFGRRFDNFAFAKGATLFVAPLLFIGLSYLIDLGLGNATISNHIITYLIAIVAGQYVSAYIMRSGYYFKMMNGYAIIGIILTLTMFIGYGRSVDSFNAPIFKTMNNYKTHILYQK